jgi:UDP-N-acetylglucosamine transferase subunit ALG13
LILISLGTHQQPFSRALDLVEPLARSGETLIIQHGSTPPRPDMENATWIEYLPFEDLASRMTEASSVVCHAGVGTIMTALQRGHTPLVLPRQSRYGEHVDDHQLDIATRFAERGLVRCVACETNLAPLLVTRGAAPGPAFGHGGGELRRAVFDAAAGRPRRGRFVRGSR